MGDSAFQSGDFVIVFLVVLFIVFSCGVIRGISNYYRGKTNHVHQVSGHRNIIITTIEVPNERRVNCENVTSSEPREVCTNPPPYTVNNDLPPSYDEAVRRFPEQHPPSYK